MSKTLVTPNSSEDNIIKVMYSPTEPPKDYIWGNPDGFYYKYENGGWNGYDTLNEIRTTVKNTSCKKPSHNTHQEQPCMQMCCCNDYIDSEKLKDTISKLRKELLTYVLKTVKESNPGSSSALIEFVRQIENRLSALESKHYVTEDNLNEYTGGIESAIQDIQSNYDGILDRVSAVESNQITTRDYNEE